MTFQFTNKILQILQILSTIKKFSKKPFFFSKIIDNGITAAGFKAQHIKAIKFLNAREKAPDQDRNHKQQGYTQPGQNPTPFFSISQPVPLYRLLKTVKRHPNTVSVYQV